MDPLYCESNKLCKCYFENLDDDDFILIFNLAAKISRGDIDYVKFWKLIDADDFRNYVVHLILFDHRLSNCNAYNILTEVNFKPNELQTKILIQKSLGDLNYNLYFLIENLPIIADLKYSIRNHYLYVSCPLLNLI